MPKTIPDIIREPTFVLTDGIFQVGDEVWGLKGGVWLLGDIKQIQFDQSTESSRYLIQGSRSDKASWYSYVEHSEAYKWAESEKRNKNKKGEESGVMSESGYAGSSLFEWE